MHLVSFLRIMNMDIRRMVLNGDVRKVMWAYNT